MPLYDTIEHYEPILIAIQIDQTTDENLRAYLDEQTEIWRRFATRRQKLIFVVDCSLGTSLNATQREMYAQWLNEARPLLDACLVGVAFVMTSALVRGALTAIFWLARLSAPHVVRKTLPEALEWALAVAKTQELPLPAELEHAGLAGFGSLVSSERMASHP